MYNIRAGIVITVLLLICTCMYFFGAAVGYSVHVVPKTSCEYEAKAWFAAAQLEATSRQPQTTYWIALNRIQDHRDKTGLRCE